MTSDLVVTATFMRLPSIASIFPSSATAGGQAFTLRVTGGSFVPASVVRWNGADRPTTFGSSTQLTAAIPAGDLATPGTAQVTVFNRPGGGTSNALTFTINPSQADLVVTAVTNPPSRAALGGRFRVTDTVRNQGTGPAGSSTTRYYLSENPQRDGADRLLTGSRAVPGLARGAQSRGSATVTIPTGTPPGTYFLLACADDLNRVAEGGEGNNCRASAATVTVTP